ncbi:Amiloride-sensitive sodium channel [Popillia japonica]|uniref:Amiloride-sensitive sodium channel n=1 Tax=Popillia japonica TaxID=7064 RepID=A0AAW1JX46_POPJA
MTGQQELENMQTKQRKNKSPSFSQNLKEYSSNYANHSSVHGRWKFNYYHFYQEGGNLTDEQLRQFEDISMLCNPSMHEEGQLVTDSDVVDFYEEVAPTFEETLWVCVWQHYNETCYTLFSPILTQEGICYTFNMPDRDEIFTDEVYHHKDFLRSDRYSTGWSLENGYIESEEDYDYPRRINGKSGLTLLIKSLKDYHDYICQGPFQGFKISLHNPGEIPMFDNQFFRAPINQEVMVAIKPDMITTSSGLEDYDPHKRGCYFAKERQLRYFKEYTQQNCELECQTNITYNLCDCVSFYMPHSEETPICGSGSTPCVNKAKSKMISDTSGSFSCDCLPACTTLTYNVETSQAKFNWRDMLIAFNADPDEFAGIQMTRLYFNFKGRQFMRSERYELYGMIDFLAAMGGLLGLFIGISLVSLIEVFYFLTLRLWVNLKRYGRHYWSGSEELLANNT